MVSRLETNASGFFQDLIDCIRDWLIGKYGMATVNAVIQGWFDLYRGACFGDPDTQGSFYIESALAGDDTNGMNGYAWACVISEYPKKNSKYIPRIWVTEIGCRQISDSSVEVSYSVKYDDLFKGHTGRMQWRPTSNVPTIIRNLLSSEHWTCTLDGHVATEELLLQRQVYGDFFGIKECRAMVSEILDKNSTEYTTEISEELQMDEDKSMDTNLKVANMPEKGVDKPVPNLRELSEEEVAYICRQLQPKGVRGYFQKNPKDFAKIKGGFRPTSLSDEDTIQLVIRNIGRPFISSMVERILAEWLDEIRQYQDKMISEGASDIEALLMTMPNCVFSENIGLYFKLVGIDRSPEYISLIETVIRQNNIPGKKTKHIEPEELDKQIAENQRLEADLSSAQADLESERAAHASTRTELENSRISQEELTIRLEAAEAQCRAAASKTTQMQSELDGLKRLARYADSAVVEEESSEYQYTSVCQVFCDHYSGQIWLSRLADVNAGEMNKFVRSEDQPYYFGNRDRLFWRDGPREEGTIGIWRWNAVPNKSDPSTDYVTTTFSKGVKVIQIVELPDCKTIKDITDFLQSHAMPVQASKKLFFTLPEANGRIAGLLCNEDCFDYFNGEARLKNSIYTLPQFVINVADIITLAGKRFYRATSLGAPQDIYQVRSPQSVVKDIVVARAANATLRALGLSKREAQHCQGFLKDLPVHELADEVAETYDCTREEAVEYVSTFVHGAISYLTETDIDTDTLARAVARTPELIQRCKSILREEFEEETRIAMLEAKAQLDEVGAQIAEKKAALEVTVTEHNTLSAELNTLKEGIEHQIALASEVEASVAARIERAKQNAADFISEMAFVTASPVATVVSHASDTCDQKESILTHRANDKVPEEKLTDIGDFIDELSDNLKASGYDSAASAYMAQMIAFSIANRNPIVCGSNTEVIAECISAMFGAAGAYSLTLPIGMTSYEKHFNAIENVCEEARQVFVINGVFDGYSLCAFNEIMQRSSSWKNSPVILLSMHGINKEAIPCYVWEKAFYLDGDAGYVELPTNDVATFECEIDFNIDYDTREYQDKRKLLKPYAQCISNIAMMKYAMYLVFSNGTVNAEPMIQAQLMLNAISLRGKDQLIETFESEGINIQNNVFLSGLV